MMRHAFSLVELSIVLVILGLLAGGILSGQALIHAAELRSVSQDINRYRTATLTFRDKYFSLPGDMTNATKFWGSAASCPGDSTTPSTTATTCDGNGNGLIEYFGVATSIEHMRAWQHLANAALIEGTYTGEPASSELRDCDAGVTCPRGRIPKLTFMFASYGTVSATNNITFFIGDYNNIISVVGDASNSVYTGILTGEDAWNIDTKTDDGRPAYGKTKTSSYNNAPNCTTAADEAAAAYNLSSSVKACHLLINLF